MSDHEEDNVAVAQAQAQQSREVKLPTFWPSRPAAWFRIAESKFRLRNITSETVRFDHLLSALPEDVISSVLDVVEQIGEDEPYTQLKDRLLETHVLSDFEKLEILYKLPTLGARKPSQLLLSMLEVCPQNEEKTKMFLFMFMQRLPRDLRLMMGDVEAGDPRAVAARADRLWACHAKQHELVAATVAEEQKSEEDNNMVAAIRNVRQKGQWQKKKFQRYNKGGPNKGQQQQEKNAPMDLAITASGLCRAHWFHGEKATKCTQGATCTWQEN